MGVDSTPPTTLSAALARSEERRVGKEGRSRCAGSADVCSPDLIDLVWWKPQHLESRQRGCNHGSRFYATHNVVSCFGQIGRASCRERGEISVRRECGRVLSRSN